MRLQLEGSMIHGHLLFLERLNPCVPLSKSCALTTRTQTMFSHSLLCVWKRERVLFVVFVMGGEGPHTGTWYQATEDPLNTYLCGSNSEQDVLGMGGTEGTGLGTGSRESGYGDDIRSSFFSFNALPPNHSFSLSALPLAAMEKLRWSLLLGGVYSAWLSLARLTLVSIHPLQQVLSSALSHFALHMFLRILKEDLATFSYQSHGSFPHIQNQSKVTHTSLKEIIVFSDTRQRNKKSRVVCRT